MDCADVKIVADEADAPDCASTPSGADRVVVGMAALAMVLAVVALF